MKGIITIVTCIAAVLIYELIVIYIFNWTGTYRTIGAGLIGIVGVSIGRLIEKKIGQSENSTKNKSQND